MKKEVMLSLFILFFLIGCTQPDAVHESVVNDIVDEVQEQNDILTETTDPKVAKEITGPEATTEETAEEPESEESPEEIAPEEVTSDPNLVGHWTFDDDATDTTNNYHGIMKGGAKIQKGIIGNALSLDGVDDYVAFSKAALDDIGSLSQGSISFWFNYESLLDTQTVMPIFYIGNKQGSPDNMFVIEIGHSAGDGRTQKPDPSDRRIYATWIKNNREPFLCFDSGKNMAENTWHHYAVVVGPEGNQGYIDGRLMENTDHNFGNDNAQYFLDSINGKKQFTLGYGRSSFMISPEFVFYKGMIDDLRVYDRPMDWLEIQDLYGMGK